MRILGDDRADTGRGDIHRGTDHGGRRLCIEYLRRVKKAEPRLEVGALVEDRPPELVPLLRELKARSYHPGAKSLDEATVREVRAAGFDVFVWTPNELPLMERLLDWGSTGLITDFPDLALELLARRSRGPGAR